MVRTARALLFAAIPLELLLTVLVLSGAALPETAVAAVEAAVAAALALEAVVVARLYRAARRRGEGWRSVLEELVPAQVRRVTLFEFQAMASLGMWAARRRSVPAGAAAVPYAGGQNVMLGMWLFAMTVETVVLDLMLLSAGVPAGLRIVLLVLGVYSVLWVLAMISAGVTRPHVVGGDELRVRYGVYFEARIPRARIASVRRVRNYSEEGHAVAVADGRLAVIVSSQTNVQVELTEPLTVVRPLGKRAEVTAVRFYADDPEAAVAALRSDETEQAA